MVSKRKNMCAYEIFREITAEYSSVIDKLSMHLWCQKLNKGRANVHDKKESSRSSDIINELIQSVDEFVQKRALCD